MKTTNQTNHVKTYFTSVIKHLIKHVYAKRRNVLFTFLAFFLPISSSFTQMILPATGTTSVFSSMPSTNYNGTSLIVGDVELGEFRTFIRFDLSSIPEGATIESAEMRIFYYTNSSCDEPINIRLYRVGGDWNPATINWNNQPGYVTDSYGSWWPSYSGYYFDLPITELANDWLIYDNFGLLLKKNSGNGCSEFFQLNSNYPPILFVKTTTVGIISTSSNDSILFTNIYPNPVRNILNIALVRNINSNILIYNSYGQRILNKSYNSKSISIDVSKWPDGLYFVDLFDPTSGSKTTYKIIKI